jgi:hypothetical protein
MRLSKLVPVPFIFKWALHLSTVCVIGTKLIQIATGESIGDLAEIKFDNPIIIEVNNLTNIANSQAFTVE